MVNETATTWEFYDPERHAGQGGNYIFLLKAFRNAPYYSGETMNFEDRFAGHGQLFVGGRRTFMRRPFIDESTDWSHAGFAARWHHYKQQSVEEQQRLVWVATNSFDETMGREGAAFWANEVALLVSPKGEERFPVEKRVQVDIMDYYDGLLGRAINWCIPPRSRLVGHGPSVVTEPTLLYQLDGGRAGNAGVFFSTLETQ